MIFYVSAASSQASAPPPAEQMRLRKKSQNLNRSDSTGSSSGRKFLAPTLSDPQTLRSDKYSQKKKSSAFMGSSMVGAGAGSSGITTPTATRPRSQILSSDHGRSKGHVLRPELTTESEEYEDVAGPSTSYGAMGAISKHTLPPLPAESSGVHFHASTSQSMHGFDLQTSPYDGGGGTSSTTAGATCGSATGIGITGRSSTFNNNSSSTGSNIAASTSKVSGTASGGNMMGASSSNTNVAYEVHDWWTDQVNYESSDEDDED